MRLLVCGLNPSVYSADAGIGFARPGNRFWPAAIAAGLVTVDRDDARAALAAGIGMTDLVKRATPRADELTRDEYRAGLARVERLVAVAPPGAVCFVGLAGWRAAVDRRAVAGVQPDAIGGRPAYVMPSTSGLNARTPPSELADHLRAAALGRRWRGDPRIAGCQPMVTLGLGARFSMVPKASVNDAANDVDALALERVGDVVEVDARRRRGRSSPGGRRRRPR